MSKSSPDLQSRILLTDTDDQIKSKIRGVVTDSIQGVAYDPETRPGAANLLAILAASTNEDVREVANRYTNKGHGQLKTDVAEAVIELMKEPRREFEKLQGETSYLAEIAQVGATKARERSEEVMQEVRKRVGLI